MAFDTASPKQTFGHSQGQPQPRAQGLSPGFKDPVHDSQESFRGILDAMARPGCARAVATLPEAPEPLDPATAATLLTLADFETPVWLDGAAARTDIDGYLKFHCGCPIVADSDGCAFGLIVDALAMPPLKAFDIGDDSFPDTSTTLVVQVPNLTEGPAVALRGPGIKSHKTIRIAGLPEWFWADRQVAETLFPLGVDIIFASGRDVIGLPRSTRIEVSECT